MTSSQLKQAQSCILHLQTSITNTTHQIQRSKQLLLGINNPQPSSHSHQSIRVRKEDINSLHLNINLDVLRADKKHEIKQYPQIIFQQIVVNGQKYVKEKLFGRMVESKNAEDRNLNIKIEEENSCDESFVEKIVPLHESSLKRDKSINKSMDKPVNKSMLESKVVRISYYKGLSEQPKNQQPPLNFSTAFPNKIKRVFTQNQQDFEHLFKNKNNKSVSILPEAIEHSNLQTNQTQKRSKDRKPIFEKKVHHSEQKYYNENRFKSIQQKLRQNEKILEGQRVQFVKWPKQKQQQQKQLATTNAKAQAIHKQMTNLRNNYNIPKRQTQRTNTHNNIPNHIRTEVKNTRSKSKSRSSSTQSFKSRSDLLKFYSNGVYFSKETKPFKCDKFKKQLNKISRQRYMADALLIPGIDKCFTYSEIYELYLKFKDIGLPEYKWSNFLSDQVRKVMKFGITQQRFTSV